MGRHGAYACDRDILVDAVFAIRNASVLRGQKKSDRRVGEDVYNNGASKLLDAIIEFLEE